MLWIDYNIDQAPDGSFKVVGDSPNEVMEKAEYSLYRPGDKFIVNEYGWLRKIENNGPN